MRSEQIQHPYSYFTKNFSSNHTSSLEGRFTMGDFTAKLELPAFIPKEQILGKRVLDSAVVDIESVRDWTYSSEGVIGMIVKTNNKAKDTSIFVPFYQIERVGEYILLKIKKDGFVEKEETKNKEPKSLNNKK
jgi:sporulation protein YlmC with PRC-barrel domain